MHRTFIISIEKGRQDASAITLTGKARDSVYRCASSNERRVRIHARRS